MIHYILTVTLNNGIVLTSTIHQDGYAQAKDEAVLLSKLPTVGHVIITRVREDNEGLWRNGRKS